jgi:hypothetical protein
MWWHTPTTNPKAVAAYHVHCYGPKVRCLVLPLDDESLTAMLKKAVTTLKRRHPRTKGGLDAADNALIVFHSLGLLKSI